MSKHIEARKGEIAKTVLMPGDPFRAKHMAKLFLKDARLVNSKRGMLAYTGLYNKKRVTIMGSGMGMPSIGIYAYELYKDYDVENIIRLGSFGAYSQDLKLFDTLLVSASYSDSSFAYVYSGSKTNITYPSLELNAKLLGTANNLGYNLKLGPIYSSDCFYSLVVDHKKIADLGFLGTEMESFALFEVARSFNRNASCILTVSNTFYSDLEVSLEDREKAFTDMFKIALESL